MKKLILILSIALLSSLMRAQGGESFTTKGTTMLSLSAGKINGAFLDLNMSPLIYRKTGSYYAFDYQRYSAHRKNMYLGNVAYMGGKGKTIASDVLTTRYIDGRVEFAWLRKAKTYEKIDVYLGTGNVSTIQFMEFNSTDEAFTYSVSHSLNLYAYADWNLNEKHRVNFSIATSVLSLLVRPPHSGYDEELSENVDHPLKLITNGDWVTINKHFNANFKMKYKYQVSDRFSTIIGYNFDYINVTTFKQFNHQLSFGITYKF